MSDRTVNGNLFTENGWRLVDAGSCVWVRVPGTNVTLQIREGQPAKLMGAFAADFNAYVEPLRDADSACYTESNSVLGIPGRNNGSNHMSATAMDLDWQLHPFQKRGSFNKEQLATIQELLDFYEDTIFWAGVDWSKGGWGSPIDEMHFQMGYDTYGSANVARVQSVIDRKIRADGFSTFRRGGTVTPPPPPPAVMTVPLVQNANGTWTSPSPAWAHLIRRESGGNPTIIQQIHDVNSGGNEAEGLFQITPRTWRAHHGDEFAPSPRLAAPQQQAIVAARIFTRNPTGSDWGAGLPGRENANQLAAGLVPTTTQAPPVTGDDMALVPQAQWDAFYQAYMGDIQSLSPLKRLGEGNIGPLHKVLRNIDANTHVPLMKLLAGLGHPDTLRDLQALAAADLTRYPDRADGKELANNILADLTADPQAVVQQAAQELQIPTPPPVVYLPASAPVAAPIVADESDTGQAIGDLFKVLQRLRLADALPIETRAPLAALIGVLQTKNGSQL